MDREEGAEPFCAGSQGLLELAQSFPRKRGGGVAHSSAERPGFNSLRVKWGKNHSNS